MEEVRHLGRVWGRFGRSRPVWNCRSPLLFVNLVGGLDEDFSRVFVLGEWRGLMYCLVCLVRSVVGNNVEGDVPWKNWE